jgi:hypothetical protein
VNANEDVYVADTRNDRIVLWARGSNTGALVGTCSSPISVYVNKDSSVYAACQTSHCIKRWDLIQGKYEKGVDTGDCGFFGTGLDRNDPTYPASVSRFHAPQGVFVDVFGNVFVSDTSNARVIKRGRSPLTQWIIANTATTSYEWQVSQLEFYTDLRCTVAPTVKSNLASDYRYAMPWTPLCASIGEKRCGGLEAFIGKQFNVATAIRCVRLRVIYDNDIHFEASVRYWAGNVWASVYSFGTIPSGALMTLRFPRFTPPYVLPRCVKGQRQCVFENLTADWQDNGDQILVKLAGCGQTAVALPGLPNGNH